MGKTKKLAVLILVLLLLIGCGFGVSRYLATRPQVELAAAAKKLADSMAAHTADPLFSALTTRGSLHFHGENTRKVLILGDVTTVTELDGSYDAGNGSAWLALSNGIGSLKAEIVRMYLADETLAAEFSLIGGRPLGVKLDNFAEDFAASAFAPDSGTRYAMDPAVFSKLNAPFAGAAALEMKNQLVVNDPSGLVSKLGKQIRFRRENGEILASLDAEGIAILTDALAEAGRDSVWAALLNLTVGQSMGMDLQAAISDWENTAERTMRLIRSSETSLTAAFRVDETTGMLCAIRISCGAGVQEEVFSLTMEGGDLYTASLVQLTSSADAFDLTVTRPENTKITKYSLKFGESAFALEIDGSRNAFALTVKGEKAFSCSGTYRRDKTSLTLDLPGYFAEGTERDYPMTLRLTTECDIPAIPEYVNLLTLSEQELDRMGFWLVRTFDWKGIFAPKE